MILPAATAEIEGHGADAPSDQCIIATCRSGTRSATAEDIVEDLFSS